MVHCRGVSLLELQAKLSPCALTERYLAGIENETNHRYKSIPIPCSACWRRAGNRARLDSQRGRGHPVGKCDTRGFSTGAGCESRNTYGHETEPISDGSCRLPCFCTACTINCARSFDRSRRRDHGACHHARAGPHASDARQRSHCRRRDETRHAPGDSQRRSRNGPAVTASPGQQKPSVERGSHRIALSSRNARHGT